MRSAGVGWVRDPGGTKPAFGALMGQLYPAILIAKLVSLQVTAESTAVRGSGGARPE
jgi:hypothetical protein